VPAGGARRGRRDNGLVAQEYAVVGDVDPRVGEHLLDVLAAGGIAAYLQPATDLHPVTRTTTLPSRPTDRLYADREHLGAAREYLTQLTVPEQQPRDDDAGEPYAAEPTRRGDEKVAGWFGNDATPGSSDEEEAWASIVAGYNATVDPTAAPWPEAEDVHGPGTGAADMEIEPAPRRTIRHARDTIDQASLLDGLDTFGADLPDDEDDDEGYTPPPPPPLPRISTQAIVAFIALVVGLVLFFAPSLLPLRLNVTLFLAFGCVLAGFVTLIWRLRPGDEEDDDPDHGARV
jgi:hypothetical protein